MTEPEQEKSAHHPPNYKKWTVLIYQAGDNNLNEECIYALKEMKRVGTYGQPPNWGQEVSLLNMLIEFDPAGRANSTRRFEIRKAGGDDELWCDVTDSKGEIDTGDAYNLHKFLCDSIRAHETDHYMVILSGHGGGMREGFLLKDDERPLSSIPSYFPIQMLRQVFGSRELKALLGHRKIDILGFDACLMSMVEVSYELRGAGTLDLVISSEGFTLNSGWPMDRIMKKIKCDPDISPEYLAKAVVTDYVNYYRDYTLGGISIDLSVIKLDRVEYLKSKIDELAYRMIDAFKHEARKKPYDAQEDVTPAFDHDDSYDIDEAEEERLRQAESTAEESTEEDELSRGGRKRHLYYYDEWGRPFQDAILLAHWASQSYNGEQCVDLYDFCNLLQKRLPKSQNEDLNSVWHACQGVKEALLRPNQGFVTYSCYAGASFQYSFGASLYFPWAIYDFAPSYAELDFAKHSQWPHFLRLYLKATRRKARQGLHYKDREKNFRYTPPTDKGPGGMIYSMRNPATTWKDPKCDPSENS